MDVGNLLDVDLVDRSSELFERLSGNENVLIERIISTGQTTPEGEWLCQDKTEFILLVTGKAELQFKGGSTFELKPGEHLVIGPNTEHRVTYTQVEPPTIWLAVHY